jgi:hypothetical protein
MRDERSTVMAAKVRRLLAVTNENLPLLPANVPIAFRNTIAKYYPALKRLAKQ